MSGVACAGEKSGDALDGIITGLNMLGEELEDSFKALAQTLAELRETQQQLIQQERLRALGEMAAGVVHDFKDLLTQKHLRQWALKTPALRRSV